MEVVDKVVQSRKGRRAWLRGKLEMSMRAVLTLIQTITDQFVTICTTGFR
jgi:hypothetical protein